MFSVIPPEEKPPQADSSIVPNPAAAIRACLQTGSGLELQIAAIDAVPGKVNEPNSPALVLDSDEGALVIAEVGMRVMAAVCHTKSAVGSTLPVSRKSTRRV